MSRVEHIGDATHVTRIYALCEYPSWEPRYVGKTVQYMGERHKAHIRDAKRGRDLPVHRWLRKKLASGERLAIKLLEFVQPGVDWAQREKFWIETYRNTGRLLNLTSGGEGLPGHTLSQEHRDKIAAAIRTGSHFQCEMCGKQFWRKQFSIKKGDCRFCSRACYQDSQRGVSKRVSKSCMERGVAAAAAARAAMTHCKRGHELSGDNLFRTSSGARGCKACRVIHKTKYREKTRG